MQKTIFVFDHECTTSSEINVSPNRTNVLIMRYQVDVNEELVKMVVNSFPEENHDFNTHHSESHSKNLWKDMKQIT